MYEFRVRVRLLFHPVAPPPSGWSEFFESEMHRTLSEVSDLAPPVEAEVPNPPPPLFLTDGTGPACDPLPEPYHLQFREALVPDSEWHDIQSGPFDGSDMSLVVSNEKLASLQEGVVFRLWRCLPGPGEGIRLFGGLASLASDRRRSLRL